MATPAAGAAKGGMSPEFIAGMQAALAAFAASSGGGAGVATPDAAGATPAAAGCASPEKIAGMQAALAAIMASSGGTGLVAGSTAAAPVVAAAPAAPAAPEDIDVAATAAMGAGAVLNILSAAGLPVPTLPQDDASALPTGGQRGVPTAVRMLAGGARLAARFL